MPKTQAAILQGWQAEICERSEQVDPGSELDWRSLWIGYAVANGMDPEVADGIYEEQAQPLETDSEDEDEDDEDEDEDEVEDE